MVFCRKGSHGHSNGRGWTVLSAMFLCKALVLQVILVDELHACSVPQRCLHASAQWCVASTVHLHQNRLRYRIDLVPLILSQPSGQHCACMCDSCVLTCRYMPQQNRARSSKTCWMSGFHLQRLRAQKLLLTSWPCPYGCARDQHLPHAKSLCR